MIVRVRVNQLFAEVIGAKSFEKTVGEGLGLSRNTLSQYRHQKRLTPKQNVRLFNRTSHMFDRYAASSNPDDFPEAAQAYSDFLADQKDHLLNNWFVPGTYPLPAPDMMAYRLPHVHCLANEWGWLGRPVSDFTSRTEFESFARDNRFGHLVPDWLIDDYYSQKRTTEGWIALRRLLDAMVICAVIEDIDCQVDGIRSKDLVLTALQRFEQGEPAADLLRESVHHFWKGEPSTVSRTQFIDKLAKLEGEELGEPKDFFKDTVHDRILRWQSGRQYITEVEMGRIAKVVGFSKLIPYLITRLVEGIVVTTNLPANEYLSDYDWGDAIEHWRLPLHQVAMATPGITIPPTPPSTDPA